MKTVITGNRGLVGSAFEEALQDHELTLVDIRDGKNAIDFFNNDNNKYDLILHCAAFVGGRKSIDLEPHKLFNNFELDSSFIQWCIKTKPTRVVAFSSSAAYPKQFQNPWDKHRLEETDIELDDVWSPDPSIYGWSKLTLEQLIRYASLDNIWTFRPFSGYSHLQSLDYPFPSFVRRAALKQDPFEIWGNGRQVRDWIHMYDVVDAVFEALKYDPDTYNICTGRATSFNEFQKIICNIVGYDPEVKHILDAPVGVSYRVGDPTKLNKIFTPSISLEDGINMALDKFNGYLYI